MKMKKRSDKTAGFLMSLSELEKRERRINRLLTLERLIRLNQFVGELDEDRFPAGKQSEIGLDCTALGRVLHLVMEDLLRKQRPGRVSMPEEIRKLIRQTQEKAQRLESLVRQIAAVVSQTYAELGDGAPLADDEALSLIRECLLNDDEQLIDRQRARGASMVRARQL
jgi:hypothetical protein